MSWIEELKLNPKYHSKRYVCRDCGKERIRVKRDGKRGRVPLPLCDECAQKRIDKRQKERNLNLKLITELANSRGLEFTDFVDLLFSKLESGDWVIDGKEFEPEKIIWKPTTAMKQVERNNASRKFTAIAKFYGLGFTDLVKIVLKNINQKNGNFNQNGNILRFF